ncbi:ATPase, T2SS/T4P/T4SS family [Clostridium estertheticum]|uniref:ATPase, T2SS/T4P/T4SS family n=1 Tax=Clostridium estertheticum TaxID=238834 RepID=UPI001C0D6B21|nr:ATPase, T2SS/T4P/T4SS family [Clostridium estertheticum]MBU3173291.1 Flp pilus assembly complex ATPase component TadA [Clostridium estertheticum]
MPTVDLRKTSYKATKTVIYDNTLNIFEIVDEINQFLIQHKKQLIIDIKNGDASQKALDTEIDKYIKTHSLFLESAENYEEILKQVNNYIWGYGPIQEYLDQLNVSDISIKNIKNDSWIKINGVRERIPVEFSNHEKLKEYCYKICIMNGGNLSKVNAKQRLSDSTTLKDFLLRITICIEPINSKSPSIIIRKIPKVKRTLEELINNDMLDLQQYMYLRETVPAGCNILICGKGASGKTTLENALIEFLPENMSKLMIQESDELTSNKGNWLWQHNVEKQGESDVEYTIQELVTLGMLEDLDFIGISEIKGAESMDLIDAGYTGHIIHTTTHAPSSFEAINKTIINMKKSGTDTRREDLLDILSTVIDVVIFMKNYKIIEITEVAGFDHKTNEIEYNPIFNYNITKDRNGYLDGYWQKIGTSCSKIQKKVDVIEDGV